MQATKREEPPVILTLTLVQVAQALNMSLRFVNTLVLSGQLPSVKFGRSRRVRLADLQAFVDRQVELS
jgi:excisionase family DNA binding protein